MSKQKTYKVEWSFDFNTLNEKLRELLHTWWEMLKSKQHEIEANHHRSLRLTNHEPLRAEADRPQPDHHRSLRVTKHEQ